MDEVYERVSEEVARRGKSWAWLAREIGSSDQTVNNWSRRGVPPARYAELSHALGWTIDRLLGREDDVPSGPIPLDANPNYPAIQRVRFKVSAGASGFEVDYLGTNAGPPIVFRADWFRDRGFRPDALFAIEVTGRSMEPSLRPGDLVIVNTDAKEPEDGEQFAVNYEGELVVKRLLRNEGSWWLASDNPDQRRYPKKLCDENTFIIGRVVVSQREH